MTLFLRSARLGLRAAVIFTTMGACYTAGGGTAPPPDTFYFPTGLAVSTSGNVLYVVNSDFDLQWNGGTLQSYDLFQIRQDAATLIAANLGSAANLPLPQNFGSLPFIGGPSAWIPDCQAAPPPPTNDLTGEGLLLGEACAPAMASTTYVMDSAIVGAFATDLQTSLLTYVPVPGSTASAPLPTRRLFAPVSGNATVTWADVADDADPTVLPPQDLSFAPFQLGCGQDADKRCDGNHAAGDNPFETGDSRFATLPGAPFGLAQSQDGTALAVTSETDTKTSLLTSGLGSSQYISDAPSMQFVLDGMPYAGVGLAAVPHDPIAVTRCEDVGDQQPCTRQAFLQTSRSSAEVDLIRYYDDSGASLGRPFLEKERSWNINSNLPGTDSRGIVVDPTPRIACEAMATTPDEMLTCAQQGARVFIANRTPPSIVVATLGAPPAGIGEAYDPDQLQIVGNVPVTAGPSKLYLAPIVVTDENGIHRYKIELFVVCFDTSTVFVLDPDDLEQLILRPVGLIYTGAGPYALAFDPFSLADAANNAEVPADPRSALGVLQYRFAYVASFTQSYLQMIDLDQTATGGQTFEHVVYTLGKPTPPKGQ